MFSLISHDMTHGQLIDDLENIINNFREHPTNSKTSTILLGLSSRANVIIVFCVFNN